MKMVERRVREVSESSESAVGIVREVVAARKFGFISVVDETSSSTEMIFFNLSSASSGSQGEAALERKPQLRKGDSVKFDISTDKKGKRVALNVMPLPKGGLPCKADKNACRGIVMMKPASTSLKNTPLRKKDSSASQQSDKSSRWDNVDKDSKKPVSEEPVTELGCILLIEDKTGMFSRRARSKSPKPRSTSPKPPLQSAPDTQELQPSETEAKADKDKENSAGEDELADQGGAVNTHLWYKNGAVAIHGVGSSSAVDESTYPRRGDIVSFVKAKSGNGVRDIRIVSRSAATLLKGRLENIELEQADDGSKEQQRGRAKFIAETEGQAAYEVDLSEVISCDPSIINDKESVEGVLHEGRIYGICRTADLYVESKLGVGNKQRPKLNVKVRKDRGGQIVAQSLMAKGPDGTTGFAPGWTTRLSRFAEEYRPQASAGEEDKDDSEQKQQSQEAVATESGEASNSAAPAETLG
jgi:cold shock CspA family protein